MPQGGGEEGERAARERRPRQVFDNGANNLRQGLLGLRSWMTPRSSPPWVQLPLWQGVVVVGLLLLTQSLPETSHPTTIAV